MLQIYPASHSYFMSIDKPNVVLKRFLEILSQLIKTFAMIYGCLLCAVFLIYPNRLSNSKMILVEKGGCVIVAGVQVPRILATMLYCDLALLIIQSETWR